MANPGYSDVYWRSADGLRLHARHYLPDGVARGVVLCIPGLTRNAADFDALAARIVASGWQVLAVDLRGRAGSQRAADPRSYNPRTYADDVAALLDTRGIDRAVFVGTSLGALVTITVATRRPALVAGAALNDAGPQVPGSALARIRQYAGKPPGPMSADAALAYVERIGRASFPHYGQQQWLAMVGRMFRQREDGLLELDYDPAIVRTTRPWLLWLLRPVLWRAWRRLARCGPTLVLRGSVSDVLPAEVARRMVATAANARLVEVPGVGHAPMLDEPEAVEAILALLEQAR